MGRPVKILDHRAEMEYGNKYIFPLAQLFGFSFEGIENVPKKGYVIFYNNHGGWGAFDWIFLWTIIYNQLNEYLTGFINPILLKIPAIGPLLKTCGAVPIDKITDLKFLKKYARIYTIAPEGPEGTTKTFTESYRLYPFRPGFIKLGLKMRAHLVPMTMIGNEDVFPVMYRTNIIKKLIGTSLPIPFTLLPLPISRIREGHILEWILVNMIQHYLMIPFFVPSLLRNCAKNIKIVLLKKQKTNHFLS